MEGSMRYCNPFFLPTMDERLARIFVLLGEDSLSDNGEEKYEAPLVGALKETSEGRLQSIRAILKISTGSSHTRRLARCSRNLRNTREKHMKLVWARVWAKGS
jgi:hypothetical protein